MGKKNRNLQVLLNEYKYMSELRERSIKNIENSVNIYLLVLGACLSSFSFFNNTHDLVANFRIILMVPIFVLIIFQIYGYFIFKNIILTHINFINYTRYLMLAEL